MIVCKITAASNIELMSSYDTSSMIEVLTNHCSLFKTTSIIMMDAGSQFVRFTRLTTSVDDDTLVTPEMISSFKKIFKETMVIVASQNAQHWNGKSQIKVIK